MLSSSLTHSSYRNTSNNGEFQVTEDDFTVNIMEEAAKEDVNVNVNVNMHTSSIIGIDTNTHNIPINNDDDDDDDDDPSIKRYYAIRKGKHTECCVYIRWKDVCKQIQDFDAEFGTFDNWEDALNYISVDSISSFRLIPVAAAVAAAATARSIDDADDERNHKTNGEDIAMNYDDGLSWAIMFIELQNYHDRVGTSDVPPNCALGLWVAKQRWEYARFVTNQPSILTQERVQRLKGVNFYFDEQKTGIDRPAKEYTFDQYIADIVNYRNRNNNHDPPIGTVLYSWIMRMKVLYTEPKSGNVTVPSIDEERCNTLENVGFDWTNRPLTRTSTSSSTEDLHINTCNDNDTMMNMPPPLDSNTMTALLNTQVATSAATTSPDKTVRDRDVDSEYNQDNNNYVSVYEDTSTTIDDSIINNFAKSNNNGRKQDKWNEMFEQLKLYKIQNGNFDVPRNSSLARWVGKQRMSYKKHKAGSGECSNQTMEGRIQHFNEIGFQIEKKKTRKLNDDGDQAWDDMFENLKSFKEKNGHCIPPVAPPSSLRKWVEKQRTEYKRIRAGEDSTLTTQRMQLLNDIQFPFIPHKQTLSWDKRYEELVEFKAKFGHCKVPRLYGTLGKWVSDQRIKYKKNQEGLKTNLTPERTQKLINLGMIWYIFKLKSKEERADRKPWTHRYEELLKFKEEHGHTVVPQHYPVLGQWVHSQRVNYKLMKQGRKSLMSPTQAMDLHSIGFAFEVMPRKKQSVRQSLANPYPHLPLINPVHDNENEEEKDQDGPEEVNT